MTCAYSSNSQLFCAMQNRHRFTGRKVCDLSFVFSERVQGGPAFIICTARDGEHGDHVTQEPVMRLVSCAGTTLAKKFKYQLLKQPNEDSELELKKDIVTKFTVLIMSAALRPRATKNRLFVCQLNKNQRRHDINGRSQMQGGKNWILPKEINAKRFF
jgi:hypothetical protein